MTIKTILAAVALEGHDDPVAGRAAQLAEQHGARLIALHVIEGLDAEKQYFPAHADRRAINEILKANARDQLKELFEKASDPAEVVVETGKPHDVIDRLIRQYAADLVVIGPGKGRTVREKMFGSTADRVVRSSPCPVLVVKKPSTRAYQQVVAAVDFSATSLAAAQFATTIAPTAMINLVHALEIPLTFQQAMLKAGTPQAEIERYRRAKAQSVREQLLVALSQKDGIDSQGRARVMNGPASDVLLRLAKKEQADLIALGTQGRGAVSQLVLGSVARGVVGAATCDVLAVPFPHAEV